MKKVEEIQEERRHLIIYTDAALGDEGPACSWVDANTGEQAAYRLIGLRNTRNAELVAIKRAITDNAARLYRHYVMFPSVKLTE